VQSIRTLLRSPAFTLTVIATIALGIGSSTAIFSVVNAVLLRPLPYREPDRLVLVWNDLRRRDLKDFPTAPGDLPDIARGAPSLEGLAGITHGRTTLTSEGAPPEVLRAGFATPNFFRVMKARILHGRDFIDADGAPPPASPPGTAGAQSGAPPPPPLNSAILTHEFWMRRFGGDRAVIGRVLELGGGRAQVVGILEPGFEVHFPPGTNMERKPEIWSAMRIDFQSASRINVFLRLVGRLKPGADIARLQTEMDAVAADLRRRFPIKETSGYAIRVERMSDDLVADVKAAIEALMGAVIFLLLIACANVANLTLVRTSVRERELAVRAALGGSRWRLVRQMLGESLMLAAAGGALGLLLAQSGIELLGKLAPVTVPRLDTVRIDLAVVAFTALAALAAAAMFGIVPALRASSPYMMEVLRTVGRSGGMGSGRLLRSGVVLAEVTLSFVLLVGCGLMFRSFLALLAVDPGYDPNNVLTFQIANRRTRSPEERAAFMRDMRDRLRSIPGVLAVTAASPLPLDDALGLARWGAEEAKADPGKFQQGTMYFVLPGYFEAMRAKLLEGRTFTDADNVPGRAVVIIDHRLAAKGFPGQAAAGKRLLLRVSGPEAEPFEVIGVIAHQRHASLAVEGREGFYLADGFGGHGIAGRWAVRTAGDPSSIGRAVREQVRAMNPALIVSEMQPMSAFVAKAQSKTRFELALIGVFAAIAALLAAVGIYGVLATGVRQRTSEIGVRMALGAAPQGIFRLVVGEGLRLSAIGLVLGLAAALALTRAMTSMLVGIRATDPLTYAAVAALFLAIAAVSCWLPARRAAGLDPTSALRQE
jgi:predicted permease